MKISQLRKFLEEIEAKEGDLNVCISEADEHWGTVDSLLDARNVFIKDHAQPEGPKSGVSERALILTSWEGR